MEPWLTHKVARKKIECHIAEGSEDKATDLLRAALNDEVHSQQVNVRLEQSGDTIYSAVAHGDVRTIRALLDNNPKLISIRDPDSYGHTLLHIAARNGQREVAELLVALGVDVNVTDQGGGVTPLHWAANSEVAELLLAKGADVNARDAWGRTPLNWAVGSQRTDVVELLRQHGGHE